MFLFVFIISIVISFSYETLEAQENTSINLAQKFLAEGNREYENGNRKGALEYYLQASKYGSTEAHYFIHYRFNLNNNQRIYHLGQAFNKGHKEAGKALMNLVFLRPISLFNGNPEKALMVHIKQKKLGHLTQSNNYVSTIQKCVNAGFFDAVGFLSRFGELEKFKENEDEVYSGWLLAERASKGGITGKNDNQLALQIVCRSSRVPNELISAVNFLSENIESSDQLFNLCNHVTSGIGSSFCSKREARISNKEFDLKYSDLLKIVSEEQAQLLKQAVNAGLMFIQKKAQTEERHGGSGRGTWVRLSIQEQKEELINLFDSAFKLKPVGVAMNYEEIKISLDFSLKAVLAELSSKPEIGEGKLSVTDVLVVQELWEDYVEKASVFLSNVDISLSKQEWEAFLTSKRVKHLENLLNSISN